MSNHQRVYSDEEFALILRKAAELASRADSPAALSPGLTLTEMKAAAAQVGIDPSFVERAARQLGTVVTASLLERMIGGPLRHDHEARFSIKLDEDRAALLLSTVRIHAGHAGSRDAGHSSSMGMTWHDGGEIEALGITARPVEEGTAVSVALDRRRTFVVVTMFSGFVILGTVLFSAFALGPEAPALGFGALAAGIGGALAVARGYWASSTRKVRQRISVVMDIIDQTITQPDTQATGFGTVGDGTAAEPDVSAAADAS